MSDYLSCPECDSIKIKIEINPEIVKLPFGDELHYSETLHVCLECGEKGIFSSEVIDENHEKYQLALKDASKHFVESVSENLSSQGNSMAYIERSLDLAQRTISRWKTNGASASGMALLRIISVYPWVLAVADKNFDKRFADGELVRQAGMVLSQHIPSPDMVHVSDSTDQYELHLVWNREGSSNNWINMADLLDAQKDVDSNYTFPTSHVKTYE